ncbi:MAG TPA: hypothetical protein VH764_02420 [Gemmatimonadales bacterium]|jgi:hypothetical protein
MTPQSSFMVAAPIAPGREAELRRLLAGMNEAPGRVDPGNSLIPFGQFETVHVARLLILDDKTLDDGRVYGLPRPTYPLYLAFLGDVDGDGDRFLEEVARRAPEGLRTIFGCCEGFSPDGDLVGWLKRHRVPSAAEYVNWRGRTVRQVREEAGLHEALHRHIRSDPAAFRGARLQDVHAALQRFVHAEASAGRLTLSPEAPTPVRTRIRNLVHLLGMPVVLLSTSPLFLLALLRVRARERTDPVLCDRVDQSHSDELALLEDHDVTNQFSAMGSVKPGMARRWLVKYVLWVIDYGARHIFTRGRLARVRSIHFARWVYLDDRRRIAFFSNYDGSLESYMDDFINKVGFGLNVVFSNGIGYPRANWLVLDGCADERSFKEYLRRHQMPSQVWYKAYPGLTAVDLERNSRIRRGLESSSLSEREAREWVALI